MWEWSKPTISPHLEQTSLCTQCADLLPQNAPALPPQTTFVEYPQDVPSAQQMEELLLHYIQNFGLHDFELKKCTYHPQTWAEISKNYAEYNHLRKSFLEFVGRDLSAECIQAGLDEEDINLLKNGQSPENYNTHIKIPFDFGGTLSLDNLCFIKTHPTHDQIHRLIEMQIGCRFLKEHKIIYIPWFAGSFYHE